MALFSECMQWFALKVLDTADIVRDGDISTAIRRAWLVARMTPSTHNSGTGTW